mmetsp:Transcript_10764/g.16514  ORF Transcript_10764/g.16514 Transcript_10764/m.16514 type:complete len:434 (-) Transcript_10764:342-1643(-)|eukprot:CAMPEP_0178904770 /NCGR_PEP_ID=MMETSP0786-20121207/5882_1 /TAXON_ID=186022 /ORGANISM="Thalassionema frauenfeldii, Strain CCMP 1798" /LENGTH=433 /DNA_ID=CAMNT_0020576259 /DNA_START=37 /DNA_END=1338 /DNA_ORIENTATION=-
MMKSRFHNRSTLLYSLGLVLLAAFATVLVSNQTVVVSPQENRRRLSAPASSSSSSFDPSSYRIATFGSSRTKGVAVPPEQTFASRLGAINFAIRASGPEYPAMCAYSMMEPHGTFDVVVLEFSRETSEKDGSLFILAARMRQHFPHVTIIFLHLWAPRQIYHVPSGDPLSLWAEREGLSPYGEIVEQMDATPWYDWRIVEPDPFATLAQTTADGVAGYVLKMPVNRDDLRETMSNYSHLFLDDYIHLSAEGHDWVYNGIVDILQLKKAKRSNYTRAWFSPDDCQSWYGTGEVNDALQIKNMEMVEFQSGKFALEVSGEGTIQVVNSWKKPMNLFVSYMVTGPERRYPKTRVWITKNDKTQKITSSHDIVPVWTTTPKGLKLHVVSHTRIGKLEVGESTLHIAPKAEGDDFFNFRLVGIMVSPYNFGDKITALL